MQPLLLRASNCHLLVMPPEQSKPKKLDLEALAQNLKAHEATLEEQQTQAAREIMATLHMCLAQVQCFL